MSKLIRTGSLAILLGVIFSMSVTHGREVLANGESPPGPDRFVTIKQEFIQYTWWLAEWSTNNVVCQVEVDHAGLPNDAEIMTACGKETYNKWISTPQCENASSDPGNCLGFYLHLSGEVLAERMIPEELPSPVVWVMLDGCIHHASTYRCDGSPILMLSGEEPLSGYRIIRLEGLIDNTPFICDPICQVALSPTDDDGVLIRFWAYSSYGDSSVEFSSRVRVKRTDDPGDPRLYVDILSTQLRGTKSAPCMEIWGIFPPVGGLKGWLSSPDFPSELASTIPYEYLAGRLISSGAVDASSCSDLGLTDTGYGSVCGLELARDAVNNWQNRFDNMIFASSQEVGIPAQLLKNIFSRESQFWPGITQQNTEAGLGQLTRDGADTTLLWNQPFFEQFCAELLDDTSCEKGYSHLAIEQRLILQDALVNRVDAFCEECALGIDLEKAAASVYIFAETVRANCAQASMVIDLNYINKEFSPSYEDFWRFTLVNYNAGPGCLGLAVSTTSSNGEPLDWEHISSNLTPACRGAEDYVIDITNASP